MALYKCVEGVAGFDVTTSRTRRVSYSPGTEYEMTAEQVAAMTGTADQPRFILVDGQRVETATAIGGAQASRRGRPKGAKNKPKDVHVAKIVEDE